MIIAPSQPRNERPDPQVGQTWSVLIGGAGAPLVWISFELVRQVGERFFEDETGRQWTDDSLLNRQSIRFEAP